MKTIDFLNVLYEKRIVGRLALTPEKKVAFEYDEAWLKDGFAISPFSLPLEKRVFVPTKEYFQGLFGVFADSLPDAWGNILVNRVLRKHGIPIERVTPLERLAIIGNYGMGALCYEPEFSILQGEDSFDLDHLARECNKILQSQESEELDQLYHLGGTSGGARPKIMTQLEGKEWIIKFPAHVDGRDVGKMEYDYSVCAKKCGIYMPETRLFESKECPGYFGIERFDWIHGKRMHMLTAAAILELNFEEPSLDYHSLMKLTKILTRDNKADIENMFRRMCFNVFAHNRDDHAKNFTFVYHEESGIWSLSPAYDLTYSNTYYGEHTTSVDGNGADPGEKELLQVGLKAGMNKKICIELIDEIRTKVAEMLSVYLN